MAQVMIDKEHPLKNTLIYVTWPFLKWFKRNKYLPDFVPFQFEDSSSEDEDTASYSESIIRSNDPMESVFNITSEFGAEIGKTLKKGKPIEPKAPS